MYNVKMMMKYVKITKMFRLFCARTALMAFFAVFSCFVLPNAYAARIKDLRIGQGVGSSRIVFDADSDFMYKISTLDNPKRIIVDVKGVDIAESVRNKNFANENTYIRDVRFGAFDVDGVRIVFDLAQPLAVKKDFKLSPQSTFDWRVAVDLEVVGEREFTNNLVSKRQNSDSEKKDNRATTGNANRGKKRIIVIDAGHGGVDPGAIGYNGTHEKQITLSMAKELKEILDDKGIYKVYLTRSRDVFIPLRERVKIARKHDGELFISIHADSARNRKAVGLSVYTLSETASDKEAAALAEKENKADIVAGVNFAEHSKVLTDILIDLSQNYTNGSSADFASILSKEMAKSVTTVTNTHRSAGFAVLKAPDVPSVLLELGYLSNPKEERLLKQKSYRKKLADIVAKSIDKYFQNRKY